MWTPPTPTALPRGGRPTASYEVEGWTIAGRADVHAMVSSTSHCALVASGCSHFLGPAVVTVDTDTAVAVCESLVLVRRFR
ncbi:hypothetical protein JOF57_001971 [Mycolicibacterium lutetiense]|uniref:SnoaL-like domain-containing protein n=2 Tax=Mycolicibacterium TaxID=1866885 RepID=A0A6N4ULY3_9MYCO|nr:hypothetical protein [Mycolicibacterium lutetiense]BBX25439.1 hypothetical protein MALV_05640 [Mycolicibacterium alvei]